MICKANGIIKFYPTTKIKLDVPIEYNSLFDNRIMLSSTNDNDLTVVITLNTEIDISAKEMAELELSRICDLLSYFHDIPIYESRITGTSIEEVTSEGKHIMVQDTAIALDVILSHIRGFSSESSGELINCLKKEYSQHFDDVISMWREAISKEPELLRYLFLYRLLESLIRDKTKELTSWIMDKEPSVQLFPDKWNKRQITIYSYLRNNIHPKQKHFPEKDITNLLPRLQGLVKQAINEQFNQV